MPARKYSSFTFEGLLLFTPVKKSYGVIMAVDGGTRLCSAISIQNTALHCFYCLSYLV